MEPDTPDTFAFQPGQYLTFRRSFDGEELRRSYSICAGAEGPLQVGVKRVEGGAFSTWVNENAQIGDRLDAMAPMGRFTLPAKDGRHVLFFAAGSGITPVLSILRTLLAVEPASRATLVYGNRMPASIMFLSELADLKNRHMTRLSLVHVLSDDPGGIPLFTGRIDAAKCEGLFAQWIDIASVDHAMICGPEAMMRTVSTALRDHGIPDARISYELFASGQPKRAARPRKSAKSDQGIAASVTVDGTRTRFRMTRDQTVLEGARAAGIDVPFACTAGVCSTCRARVTEGEVEMRANHALEDDEIADGYVLTCQSVVLGDEVAVDYEG